MAPFQGYTVHSTLAQEGATFRVNYSIQIIQGDLLTSSILSSTLKKLKLYLLLLLLMCPHRRDETCPSKPECTIMKGDAI